MVSKTTVTYSTPRNRRYRRRSYFYRYTYKKYRSYANRLRLNYYKAKINVPMTVFKAPLPNFEGQYYYVIGDNNQGGGVPRVQLWSELYYSAEYALYKPLFNEVKLLGVALRAVPAPCNNQNFAGEVTVPNIQMSYTNGVADVYNDHLFLNVGSRSYKYWKNLNRHWLPSGQTAGDQAAGNTIVGDLIIDGPVNDNDKSESPCWALESSC